MFPNCSLNTYRNYSTSEASQNVFDAYWEVITTIFPYFCKHTWWRKCDFRFFFGYNYICNTKLKSSKRIIFHSFVSGMHCDPNSYFLIFSMFLINIAEKNIRNAYDMIWCESKNKHSVTFKTKRVRYKMKTNNKLIVASKLRQWYSPEYEIKPKNSINMHVGGTWMARSMDAATFFSFSSKPNHRGLIQQKFKAKLRAFFCICGSYIVIPSRSKNSKKGRW